jgi:choline dehydrogenase-like flavoprotein
VTLPAAARTGRLTLVSDAVVSHVMINEKGKAKGVYYVDRSTHVHLEARAKVVVLAASALESTRILLNSSSSRFPAGLGNSSGQLGHYLMDHFTLEGAGGYLPQFKSSQRAPTGTPCGFLIPKYVNTGKNANNAFLRGYRFDGDGSQELYAHAFGLAGFGSAWREKIRSEIPYYFAITVQGECLPRYDNYVTLDLDKKDAWGIPALRIVANYGENEHAMAKAMRQDVLEILDAMKLDRPQPPGERLSVFGKNIHECGTARMGVDPKKSVVNGFGQLYDATNVFVTDGAVFATQGCYEPTLTIMAISARAGDYIVDEYRRGNL